VLSTRLGKSAARVNRASELTTTDTSRTAKSGWRVEAFAEPHDARKSAMSPMAHGPLRSISLTLPDMW